MINKLKTTTLALIFICTTTTHNTTFTKKTLPKFGLEATVAGLAPAIVTGVATSFLAPHAEMHFFDQQGTLCYTGKLSANEWPLSHTPMLRLYSLVNDACLYTANDEAPKRCFFISFCPSCGTKLPMNGGRNTDYRRQFSSHNVINRN